MFLKFQTVIDENCSQSFCVRWLFTMLQSSIPDLPGCQEEGGRMSQLKGEEWAR
jgi:hypothetical protein